MIDLNQLALDERLGEDRQAVLVGVVGSTAYGLATPDSDVDRLGVFQVPTKSYLGRFNKGEISQDTFVGKSPDIQMHEVGKFVRLAAEMNPTVTELLWLPTFEVVEWVGVWLWAHRDLFLSARACRARYGGYARSQVKRLLDRGNFGSDLKKRQAKHGRHTARLLIQARGVLQEGKLTVRLTEDEAARCFEWGEKAQKDPQGFAEVMEPLLDALDVIPSDLPEEPDLDAIRDLLVTIRLHALNAET